MRAAKSMWVQGGTPDMSALSRRRALAITLLVAGAFFMEMLDGTVIATALPQMAATFGVAPVSLNIGMTAYLLALAVFLPISGWIADRFGARTVFACAIGIFTFASLLCALSTSLPAFTAARILQGIGGAAMVPVGRLIVLRITDKSRLMTAMTTIVWPGLVAPVLAPPIGGYLATHHAWQWIFLLNIPLGIVAIALAMILVPNLRSTDRRPLDFIGLVLSGLSLVLLVYGVNLLGAEHPTTAAMAMIAAGGVLAWLAIRHFRRHPTPLLDLTPLRIPTFAIGIYSGSIARIAIGTAPFLLPLLFQIGFGWSAFAAGALLLWIFAGDLFMKAFNNRILRRLGFRPVMIANTLLLALSLAACGLLTPNTPLPLLILLLLANGIFRSMQFTALTAIQFADIPPPQLSGANTLVAMLTKLTLGVGVVIGAAALNLSSLLRGHASGTPDLVDFRFAFFGIAVLALFSLRDLFRLDPAAGQNLRGRYAT